MKIIINENERGFLFKNGEFKRMLLPGKNSVNSFLGETYIKTKVEDLVEIENVNISTLLRDEVFVKSVTKVEVPDLHVALHFVDGRLLETLKSGTYYFWNVYHAHNFDLIDLINPDLEVLKEKMTKLPTEVLGKDISKVIISENERGFLFVNGEFQEMMLPGKHTVFTFLGQSYTKVNVSNQVSLKDVDINILLKDEEFAKSVTKLEVPDLHVGVHFEDGRAIETFRAGTYYFWNIYHEQTFEIIDIAEPSINLSKEKIGILPVGLYHKFTVSEGEVGLLYFDGKFKEELKAGTYYFWKNAVLVNCQIVDLRSQQLDVNSQEILTADKVSLRLNFVCTYKISDAVKINNTLKDYKTQIYVTTQLVLREYIGRLKFDELLEQKDNIAGVVFEKLKEKQESLFIEFVYAGLKDIILPGEIRDIMNTVLIAEKNAQANVISRREEVASTRSLLNTAKLMEENQTLYKLKELEYLEKICDKVGNISVGNGNLLSELGELLATRKTQ